MCETIWVTGYKCRQNDPLPMLEKLTAAVVARPAVVVVAAVVTLVVVATLAGDAATAVDATTLGTENGTLVEPMDGAGGTGPPEVDDVDGL